MKSIHERVRAKLEKAARDEQRAADAAHDRRLRAAERRDQAVEDRIEGLRNGTIMPRNAREDAIQCDMLEDLYPGVFGPEL
jgi:hypothetical protein